MLRKLKRLAALPGRQQRDFLRALALLPLVSVGMRVAGFRRCHAWLVRPPRGGAPLDPSSDTFRLVAAACSVLPLRPTCLTRSLALVYLLRRRGHAAELRIGVRKAGEVFGAHAWVECGGESFGHSDGGPEYAAFERITPTA